MVSKFSKHKEAVIDFVKFLLREDSQEVFYANGGYYPVLRSFYEDSTSVRKHPELSAIKERMRTGVHRPAEKGYTNYSKTMSHYFGLAIKNRIPVAEALGSATRAIQSDNRVVLTR
jgi:ABC-type glycerol-3-phosphate transport system substrate-binding protein